MQLDGKIVLITGGSSGIGFGTAQRMIEEGAKVIVTGIHQPEVERAAAALGHDTLGICADVSSKEAMAGVARSIRDKYGRLDCVFANAGGGGFIALEDITGEQFDHSFAIDVKGVLFTVQTALPLMGAGSSIIITTSVTAQMGLPNFSIYAAGKAALRSFVRTWCNELRERGIRVNAVAPGVIPTEGYGKEMAWSDEYVEAYKQR
ncbi:SDR family NAD(P)-dependent oxidoreductase, partial [Sphingobium sp. H39-3-25]|uniref:SDR family NAD(P)-dependent oxidoreductase n=1 Tax=Sphingobium arseniciresistens TaxID=3030834 RepID=UPI0023B9FF90|nr:SDR family NAD(P)-dependent oxidoreductase [Sphingobium arseniciresistens]